MRARSVLVVDDDADIREIVQLSLEMHGWTVLGESTGERAVARAAESRPDLILLDVNLEGMDGPTTLAALRADPRTTDIPVLFLTGTSRPADVERLQALGANGMLAKPFDPLALGTRIRGAMGWPE